MTTKQTSALQHGVEIKNSTLAIAVEKVRNIWPNEIKFARIYINNEKLFIEESCKKNGIKKSDIGLTLAPIFLEASHAR